MVFVLLDMAFVRGCLAGFALAAPIGPVGVMCIRRALAHGRLSAFLAGLGAAMADAVFGAAAGLGVTVVSTFITSHALAFGVVGGVIVLGLGVATLRAPNVPVHDLPPLRSAGRDFAVAFTTAITNPATVVAAAGIFTAYGPVDPVNERGEAVALVAGVFAGSALWWLVLASLTALWRERFTAKGLKWLNRISGTVLLAFGAAAIAVAFSA